jgi:hypothetical protein
MTHFHFNYAGRIIPIELFAISTRNKDHVRDQRFLRPDMSGFIDKKC